MFVYARRRPSTNIMTRDKVDSKYFRRTQSLGLSDTPRLTPRRNALSAPSLDTLADTRASAPQQTTAPQPSPPSLQTVHDAAARRAMAALGRGTLESVQELDAGSQGELEVMRYLVPNAAGGMPGSLVGGAADGPHGALDANSWQVADTSTFSASGNRWGGGVGGSPDDGKDKIGAFYDVLPTLGVSDSCRVWENSGGDSLSVSGAAFSVLGGPVTGVGAGLTYSTAAGAKVGVGPAFWMTTSSEFTVLRTYEGHDPKLQGQVLVRWHRVLAPAAGLDLSFGTHHFGLGGKLMLTRGRQLVCELYVPPHELAETLHRRGKVPKLLRHVGESMGLMRAPVEKTRLQEALAQGTNLHEGESVRFSASGTITVGLSAGAAGLRGTVASSYTGDHEFTVRRLDKDHVEVIVAPKKEIATSVSVEALLVGDAYHTNAYALGTGQGFRFDIGSEAGRRKLKEALSGTLPSNSVSLTPLKESDEHDLPAMVRGEAMPDGVSRTHIEKAERPTVRSGIGLPLPTEKIGGGSLFYERFGGSHLGTNGPAFLAINQVGLQNETQKFVYGKDRARLSATRRRLGHTLPDGTSHKRFDGVEVEADLSQTRAKGKSRDGIGKTFEKAFSTSVRPFGIQGKGQTYGATALRLVTPAELRRLAVAQPHEVEGAAKVVGADAPMLQRLVEEVRDILHLSAQKGRSAHNIDVLEACATRVQTYTTRKHRHMFDDMAALHTLLDPSQHRLKISTRSSAYDKPYQKAQELLLKYDSGPLPPSVTTGQVLKEANKVARKLRKGMDSINDDQIGRAFNVDRLERRLMLLAQVRGDVLDLIKAFEHIDKTGQREPAKE